MSFTAQKDKTMKYCTKCKQTLSLDNFYTYKRKEYDTFLIYSYCKKCTYDLNKKRIIKKENKNYNKVCKYCNKEFIAISIKKEFCCESHRVGFYKGCTYTPKKEDARTRINTPSYLNKREKKIHLYNWKLNKVWIKNKG